jgi:hypothetical protein
LTQKSEKDAAQDLRIEKPISANKEFKILSITLSDGQKCPYIFKKARLRTSLVSIFLIVSTIPMPNAEGS